MIGVLCTASIFWTWQSGLKYLKHKRPIVNTWHSCYHRHFSPTAVPFVVCLEITISPVDSLLQMIARRLIEQGRLPILPRFIICMRRLCHIEVGREIIDPDKHRFSPI